MLAVAERVGTNGVQLTFIDIHPETVAVYVNRMLCKTPDGWQKN